MPSNFAKAWLSGLLMITTAFSSIPVGLTPSAVAAQTIAEEIEVRQRIPDPLPISDVRATKIRIPVTAYSSTPDQTDSTPFITANQTVVHDGVVAANFLKFNTRVRIRELYGDKVFVVADRMNARYWKKMDIWMANRKDAQDFGLVWVDIEILPPINSVARN